MLIYIALHSQFIEKWKYCELYFADIYFKWKYAYNELERSFNFCKGDLVDLG